MADFDEDAVVSLEEYFWGKKKKTLVKKGAKRIREGTVKKVPTQIIWKSDSSDTKPDALETTAAMVALARANCD